MATAVRVRETRPAHEVQETPRPATVWWALVLGGGLLGVVSGAWQTVERIAYAAGTDSGSICEINSVLSCNSVYSHWQSSALGIPNTMISIPVFAMLAAVGLAGLLGSRLSGSFLTTMLGATVFMAAFLTWYLLYVFMSNWASDFMSYKLVGHINVALVFGLLQFVTTFGLAFMYARYMNREVDPIARQLEAQYDSEAKA